MHDLGISQERGKNPTGEIVPVPIATRAKIYLGTAPIASLTIRRLGPNFNVPSLDTEVAMIPPGQKAATIAASFVRTAA
jgi:hypothetical protein